LQVSPDFLEFGVLDLRVKPAREPQLIIHVKNAGGGTLSGRVQPSVSWLKISPADFSCTEGRESEHKLTLDSTAPRRRWQRSCTFSDAVLIHSTARDQTLSGSYLVNFPVNRAFRWTVAVGGLAVLFFVVFFFRYVISFPTATAAAVRTVAPLLAAKTIQPIATLTSTTTSMPTNTPKPFLFSTYDDFSTGSTSSPYSTDLWTEDTSTQGRAEWQNGYLYFTGTNGGKELQANSPSSLWTWNDIGHLQADLRIDSVSGGYGFTKIQINNASDLPDGKGAWWTQCRVGAYSSTNAEIICDSYRWAASPTILYQSPPLSIQFGKFYTLSIEIAPEIRSISYYVNKELIGTFTPDQDLQKQLTSILFTWRIGLWMDSSATASGAVDNVMVGPQ